MRFSYESREGRLLFLGGRRGGVLDAREAHPGLRAVPSGGRCLMGLPTVVRVRAAVAAPGSRTVARRPSHGVPSNCVRRRRAPAPEARRVPDPAPLAGCLVSYTASYGSTRPKN